MSEQRTNAYKDDGYARHKVTLRGSAGEVYVRLRTNDPGALERIIEAVGMDAKVMTLQPDGRYH